MSDVASGLLSDLLLVRLHRRTAQYLDASDADRPAVIAACRSEATVGDLAERILGRTIYAQSASRAGALRELLQNALDASPRGARIEVRSRGGGPAGDEVVTVVDRGRGMGRLELLEDLLVPFRSRKEDEPEAIGEHGIGFLSALEIAPRIEITSATRTEAHRLRLEPLGGRAPYADFLWTLTPEATPRAGATGTTVRLELARPIDRATLAAEIASTAGLVDPARARILVNDALINAARARLRRVASAAIGEGGELGELTLYLGRGDGIAPRFVLTQRGLFVTARQDAFADPERTLHRDLARAIASAGYGLVVELPLAVPLNKGRSAVAGCAARAVDAAVSAAFERFVLEDALFDRELLRSVDHRLSSVLDRLVVAALAGDDGPPPKPPAASPPPAAEPAAEPVARARARDPEVPRPPTVAAPPEVIRFAGALLDAPLLAATTFDPLRGEARTTCTLRAALRAHRGGLLRAAGDGRAPGVLYLSPTDPLAHALLRRLGGVITAAAAPSVARGAASPSMPRVSRERLLAATPLPGMKALAAAMLVIEQIDASIAEGAGLTPSPVTVHQDLYGPDEMAHTDGAGISVNLASPRIRALVVAMLGEGDPIAFGALVDLMLHEKAHVSLATHVPRANAEHGSSFYRQKDWLRRCLLHSIGSGRIADPIHFLAIARRGLGCPALPSPEALALAVGAPPLAA